MYNLDDLDKLMNEAACNLIANARNTDIIHLKNLNPHLKSHRAILRLAQVLMSATTVHHVSVDMPFLKYKFTKWRLHFKELLRSRAIDAINVQELISTLEYANKMENGFEEIYNQYYSNKRAK